MALDRGTLGKIDRRVFAELDHTDGVQAVKVPLSDAVWSTWRRYCEAIGLSMGEGVAGLISYELETVVRGDDGGEGVFANEVERSLEERVLGLEVREGELDARAGQLGRREEQLRVWEQRIRTQRLAGGRGASKAKIGRNERCPCGSGLKHKHCHGLPGGSR